MSVVQGAPSSRTATTNPDAWRAGDRSVALPLPPALVRAIVVVLLVGKLAFIVFARPYMDETYYFLWGQHPALSYYDHPSLIGWTQGLSAAIFGWNVAALREPVFLTLCGDLYLLYLFARRLGDIHWRDAFWSSALLFLSLPITLLATGLAVPDHLLVFFTLAALYCLYRLLETQDAGTLRWRWLYAAAIAIGFATLSKYYGVLIGVAALFTFGFVPRYRRLFATGHLYAAIALTLVLQLPVLIWNLQHGLASFAFAAERPGAVADWPRLAGTQSFLIDVLIAVLPFLIWPMLRYATAQTTGPARPAQALMWISTLLFLAVSTITTTIIHWNLMTYVAAVPFLAAFIRSRLLIAAHLVVSAVVLGALGINYAAIPLVTLLQRGSDQATSWGYGWSDVASRVAALQQTSGATLIATTDYALAGELGFALRDADVTSLSPNTEAFDFWSNPNLVPGATAVIVADDWRGLSPEIRAQFGTIEAAGTVDATALGRVVDHYTLYVGRDYRPPTGNH